MTTEDTRRKCLGTDSHFFFSSRFKLCSNLYNTIMSSPTYWHWCAINATQQWCATVVLTYTYLCAFALHTNIHTYMCTLTCSCGQATLTSTKDHASSQKQQTVVSSHDCLLAATRNSIINSPSPSVYSPFVVFKSQYVSQSTVLFRPPSSSTSLLHV